MSKRQAATMGAPPRALILVLSLITLCLGVTMSVWAEAPRSGAGDLVGVAATTSTTHGYDGPAKHAMTYAASGTNSVLHAAGPGRQPWHGYGAPVVAVSTRLAAEGLDSAVVDIDQLSSSQLSNYTRYLKGLPKGADYPTVTQLPDGSIQFSADVPATNIPGSYATYTKVIGEDGSTITYYKTTIAPDGSVVSVKVKYP
jgi:hypothetical protein